MLFTSATHTPIQCNMGLVQRFSIKTLVTMKNMGERQITAPPAVELFFNILHTDSTMALRKRIDRYLFIHLTAVEKRMLYASSNTHMDLCVL